jgi:antitoxin (DNA-binding transcriptional repressor) of toxin-antitoxin stability system
MKRIDLDDVPPKIAALLTEAEAGEELLLVQGGAVVGRLVAGGAGPAAEPEPPPNPEAQAKEIFELFRSSVEDEF